MGKIIMKNVIERKKGFLYYIDGQGNVCEAKMRVGGKKKKKVIKKKVIPVKKVVSKKIVLKKVVPIKKSVPVKKPTNDKPVKRVLKKTVKINKNR